MTLAQHYARNLLELATARGITNEVDRDLKKLSDLAVMCPEFAYVLRVTFLPRYVFSQVIDDISREMNLEELTANFLRVLSSNGRKSLLVPISRAFEDMIKESRVLVVSIDSSEVLSESQRKLINISIREVMKKSGKAVDIVIKEHVNLSLLGGFVVRFGPYLIDTSIRSQLNRLRMISLS